MGKSTSLRFVESVHNLRFMQNLSLPRDMRYVLEVKTKHEGRTGICLFLEDNR